MHNYIEIRINKHIWYYSVYNMKIDSQYFSFLVPGR